MALIYKIGSSQTHKERLALTIVEILRNAAPEAAYHFSEAPEQQYLLTLYWGSNIARIYFTNQQAEQIDTEDGREALRAQLLAAIIELIRLQKLNMKSN